jgi:hypothetical protein
MTKEESDKKLIIELKETIQLLENQELISENNINTDDKQ